MPALRIRVIRVIYDALPEPERFLKLCAEIVSHFKNNELLAHYDVSTELAADLDKYRAPRALATSVR